MGTSDQSPPNLVTRLAVPTPAGLLSVITSLPISTSIDSLRPHPSTGHPANLPAILFIHGNSSSSQIFRDFFFPPSSTKTSSPPLCATHRLIAFDLPGHGDSPNAPSTPPPTGLSTHYCIPSYAQCALVILNHLQITTVLLFGWSLGGHVAISLLALLNPTSLERNGWRCKGICLTGTPPLLPGRTDLGFKLRRSADGKPFYAEATHLSEDEIIDYATASAGVKFGGKLEPFHVENVRRCDGRSRSDAWRVISAGKEGADERMVVEAEDVVSTAVINGAGEEAVNLDYLDTIKWGNLWKGECIRLEGLGHGPFWEDFGRFEPLFKEWVEATS